MFCMNVFSLTMKSKEFKYVPIMQILWTFLSTSQRNSQLEHVAPMNTIRYHSYLLPRFSFLKF